MSCRVELRTIVLCLPMLAALCGGALAQSQDAAQDAAAWRVSKSSGSVWVVSAGVQPASLTDQAQLKPGDSIRTGSNGRVLLERGTETILIAPNSALTIPATQKDAASTTILQQSGSIRLQVDKRNVRSFEVETPYLVAAVKGTQFTVTVNKNNAAVQVFGGSVEVSDFKSGDVALVAPGQSATVSAQGNGGLSLSGTGVFAPIQHGTPHPSPVSPLTVPRNGLSAPVNVPGERHVRALGGPHAQHGGGPLHIGAPLGELRLDIHRVTHGLARGNDTASVHGSRQSALQSTFWSSGDVTPGNGVAKAYNQGNNGSGNGAGTATGSGNGSAGGAASAGANGNGNGNANGQGNGNGNGAGNGNGQGNVNANGNGANNNNGNGNKNGHHKG